MSLFPASVQINLFVTTNQSKLLHVTVKAAVLDVYAPFRTHLQGYLTLDASGGEKYPTAETTGLKISGPPTKHQKAILAKLVFHIYRKQHSHLSTAIGKIIAGEFFFGMQSCE